MSAKLVNVDDCGLALGVALNAILHTLLAQVLLRYLELALISPATEAFVSRRSMGEGLGKSCPRAARVQRVTTCIDHRAPVVICGLPAAALGKFEAVCDQLLLGIGQRTRKEVGVRRHFQMDVGVAAPLGLRRGTL